MKVKSFIGNPILRARGKSGWESRAVYNGSVIKNGNGYLMLYRAEDEKRLSTIGMATSHDGHLFDDRRQIIGPSEEWDRYGCEDPRICKVEDKYFIFYTAIGGEVASAENIRVGLAITTDFENFEKHRITPFNAKAMSLFPEKIGGEWWVILTANTDLPPSKIAVAKLDRLEDLWNDDFWRNWYYQIDEHQLKLQRTQSDQVEVGASPVKTKDGWVVIYAHIQGYTSGRPMFGIEAMLLDKDNPQKIIGRTVEPIMIPQEDYELAGLVPNVIFPSGAVLNLGQLMIYYSAADTAVAMAMVDQSELLAELKKNVQERPRLIRLKEEPIISPKTDNSWESRATFNPATVMLDEKIYIVYRAMSEDNTSSLGLAVSEDGMEINKRWTEPIFKPQGESERKGVAGGNSGCEDPRITQMGNRLYMCYTAYNGLEPPRVAMTSILINDFKRGEWRWEKSKLISPSGEDNKDACLFPRKINGRYVFCHRARGKGIVIDYLDDIDFENGKYLESDVCLTLGHSYWDDLKIGIAAPPIETSKGWLLLYHGVSRTDNYYRVGAMLLALDDPSRVIGRTKYPLLEPEKDWEKVGEVNNVVFPCGAVVKNDQLLVYYGGADKFVGVAGMNLKEITKLW